MIVDGAEVLYTMRNGKIVDPNIPMDGLVCFLDTRGKYNTDIYRNTLLDLSGNGNHGTLQNFSFTDGSGYENGGLKFDGVDDYINVNIEKDIKSFSVYFDWYIPSFKLGETMLYTLFSSSDLYRVWIVLDNNGFNLKYTYRDNRILYLRSYNAKIGENKILLVADNLNVSLYVNRVKAFTTLENPIALEQLAYIRAGINDPNRDIGLVKYMFYNKAMTDQEITQLMEA